MHESAQPCMRDRAQEPVRRFREDIHFQKITGRPNDSDFTLMFAAVDRQVIPAPAVDTESEVRA